MRLINARTLRLETFVDGRSAPPYAILSHTWCKDEVLFHDMTSLNASVRKKKGWQKIEYTCAQALKDGLRYAWVDTCCMYGVICTQPCTTEDTDSYARY